MGYNTLTDLAPVLYGAMQTVPREITGIIPSVNFSFDDKGAALGDTVKMPVIGALTSGAYSPAMTSSAGTAQTPTSVSFSLDNADYVSWSLTGEEEQSLMNGGDGAVEFLRQNTEQGIRTLANTIEARLYTLARKSGSRATGTTATSNFGSTVGAVADVAKILVDNGFSVTDGLVSLVLSTSEYFAIQKLATFNNNGQGSNAGNVLTFGEFMQPLFGVKMRTSSAITAVTQGSGATSYAITGNQAIGSTSIAIKTGTATIGAGDLVKFASDTGNTYVSGAQLVGAGSLTLGKPGIKVAVATNDVVTLPSGALTSNLLIHKAAIALKVRPQILPANANIQQMPITDAKTGLTFQMCKIAGDGMVTYRLQCVSGMAAIQREAIAILAS